MKMVRRFAVSLPRTAGTRMNGKQIVCARVSESERVEKIRVNSWRPYVTLKVYAVSSRCLHGFAERNFYLQ